MGDMEVMMEHNSLAESLEVINEALFSKGLSYKAKVDGAIEWIAGRQVRSGKYTGMFAPTDRDYGEGVRLFTGERLRTRLATRNVLTAEAARLLALLGPGMGDELRLTDAWLEQQCFSKACVVGECAHSTLGLMRYLAARAPENGEQRLEAHIAVLSQHRDGKGRWERFPFYYTLLTLAEIDLPGATEEMRYAAPACERVVGRLSKGDRFVQRRRAVVERVLSRC
jgi:hypothetical protein